MTNWNCRFPDKQELIKTKLARLASDDEIKTDVVNKD